MKPLYILAASVTLLAFATSAMATAPSVCGPCAPPAACAPVAVPAPAACAPAACSPAACATRAGKPRPRLRTAGRRPRQAPSPRRASSCPAGGAERGWLLMWKLKSTPKALKVTSKLAHEFAELDAAPHDRPLSERRLAIYQRIMARGEFRPCTWAKAYCEQTGQWYRVNGKHTSTMLSGMEQVPDFCVTIEEYQCETLEDVARLYATYDSKLANRTSMEINRTFAASVPELSSVQDRIICAVVSGLAYAKHGDGYGAIPAAERAEMLFDAVEFCLWVQEMIGGSSDCLHLRRVPVVAAMYGTWLKSHKDASGFWEAVRNETGDSPSRPDRRLAKFLLTVNVDNGRGAARARRCAPKEFYVKCIHAWNAWRKDQSTDLKYYSSAKVPAIV